MIGFTFANRIVGRGLPFADADRDVRVSAVDPLRGNDRVRVSVPTLDCRESARAVEALSAIRNPAHTLTGQVEPVRRGDTVAASCLPARRAMRVDPIDAHGAG